MYSLMIINLSLSSKFVLNDFIYVVVINIEAQELNLKIENSEKKLLILRMILVL